MGAQRDARVAPQSCARRQPRLDALARRQLQARIEHADLDLHPWCGDAGAGGGAVLFGEPAHAGGEGVIDDRPRVLR